MQACLYVPHTHTRDTVSRNAREAKVITVAVLLLVRVLAVGWRATLFGATDLFLPQNADRFVRVSARVPCLVLHTVSQV
jgi:hypothetical protein